MTLPGHVYARARALGEGSFGAVVVVYSTETGEEYAGKAFDWADDGTMAVETLREICVLRALRDFRPPTIVELVDLSTTFEGRVCPLQIMPIHSGGALEGLIGGGALSASRRLALVVDLLRAVTFLHECLVMHRDIKPGNVVLDADGRGVLVDFSFARLAERATEDKKPHRKGGKRAQQQARPTVTGNLGTPTYTAPEVLAEEAYDERCDLWSCGVVALELLRDSFLEADKDRAALRVVRGLRDRLSDRLPGSVVRTLLQDAPEDRGSAHGALLQLGGQPGPRGRPLQAAPPAPPGSVSSNVEAALAELDFRSAGPRGYAAALVGLLPRAEPLHVAILAAKLAEGQAVDCDDASVDYRSLRDFEVQALVASDGGLLYGTAAR